MDLQTERRLEQFLRLSDLPLTRIAPRMEFSVPPLRLYIEYTEGRILLSVSRPIAPAHRIEVLKRLLAACHPARTAGVPLRAYTLREHQVLSCAPAPGSETGDWIACHQAMRRLLETCAGESR